MNETTTITTTKTKVTYDYGTKNATHHITVQSIMKGFPDTKSFAIHAPKETLTNIRNIIKNLIKEENKDGNKLTENIYLIGEEKKNTHIIFVKEPETNKPRKSKSFRIKQPSYSAEEIAATIKQRLTGETKFR